MKLSSIKQNTAKIESGAWVSDIPDMAGLKLRVRGFGNTDDLKAQDKFISGLPRAQRARGMNSEQSNNLMTSRLLEAILVDWDGITDDDEKPIKFSRDKAEELLCNPDYAALRSAIVWAANVVGEEGAESLQADAKN